MFCLINLDNGEAMRLPLTASAVEHGDHSSWQCWEMVCTLKAMLGALKTLESGATWL